MRKLIWLLIACLLAGCAPALAERVEYADQGGVRVFAEDGRAGLMDAEGAVILPAEYDFIEPFCGADYTRLRRDGLWGVARRDGSLAVDCEWQYISLYEAAGWAVYDSAANAQTAVALETGEARQFDSTWLRADDRYLYAVSYGEMGFGPEPPYHTDVYEGAWNRVLSVDGWVFGNLQSGYAEMEDDEFKQSLINFEGNAVVSRMLDAWSDGERWFYIRPVKNPLNRWLKPLKLDRRHVEYYLRLLGVPMEGRWARAFLNLYGDGGLCGIVNADGSRVELPGRALEGPDAAGLYRVRVSGSALDELWGYADANGDMAIPAAYNRAYPFVDGAAVVRQGKRWRLIDLNGDPVGEAWRGTPWQYSERDLTLPVVPAGNYTDGYRVIDRRGEYVTDEVFSYARGVFNGKYLILTDAEGRHCLMDGDGRIVLRAQGEFMYWYGNADDSEIWLQQDGLWGLMAVAGDDAGQWRVEPRYTDVNAVEKGDSAYYAATLADGASLYIDGAGAALGPSPNWAVVDF